MAQTLNSNPKPHAAHVQAMRTSAHAPVLHLSTVNPYIDSTLGDWHKKHGLAAAVPRQAGPAPQLASAPGAAAAASPAAVGTSSFGMSGVNAHVLMRPSPDSQPLGSAPAR